MNYFLKTIDIVAVILFTNHRYLSQVAINTTAYNNTAMGGNALYSISYAQFVVPLVKAVQELNTQKNEINRNIEKQQMNIEKQYKMIDQLISRLQTLESNNIK